MTPTIPRHGKTFSPAQLARDHRNEQHNGVLIRLEGETVIFKYTQAGVVHVRAVSLTEARKTYVALGKVLEGAV